jgi:gamma-glutamylcyclotransferase (GGCT)/AIG2-like uncharacterized protein YtfP
MLSRVSKTLVFVYGTLRRGGERAMERLFPDAHYVGVGCVRGALYDLGDYPGLVLDAGAGTVTGELYTVTPRLLADLDEYEGYRSDDPSACLYVRKRVDVEIDGELRRCWLYTWNRDTSAKRDRIPSGDWAAHLRERNSQG